LAGREDRDAESKRMAEVWERWDGEVGGDGDTPLLRGLSAVGGGGSGYQVSL
jgi:hypothetical protein